MTLFALILALLLEQIKPLPVEQWVLAPLRRVSAAALKLFGRDSTSLGIAMWLVLVAGMTMGVAALFLALREVHPLLGLFLNLAVLYLTMGFRHESHYFSDIHLALGCGDTERARALIGEWRGKPAAEASEAEISRLAIEQALVAAHRSVFGVSFWFAVLPGPSGAVLYRLARFFAEDWRRREVAQRPDFAVIADRALAALDWLPARLTAMGFSVAGNFEDAVLCWRTQARQWHDPIEGILISSGGGALGVRLGLPVHGAEGEFDRPEMGTGGEAGAEFMQSTIGLIWRTLVLCLLLLTLLGIAGWVGA